MKILQLLGFGSLALTLGFSVACSDDGDTSGNTNSNGGGGSSTTTTTTSANGGGGTGGTAPTCDGPGQTYDMIDSAVGAIDGTILDIEGNPAVDVLADVCGTNICLEGKTEANGAFLTNGMDTNVVDVRLIYGSGLRYAQMTSPIGDATGFSFGTINTVALPDFAEGAAISAGASATSNDVTIDVEAGAAIGFDIILYGTPAEQTFRATVFAPTDGNFPAVPASANVGGLVATAPINTHFCPGVRLTVPNNFGFTADADLDVLYHGTSILTDYAPYGGWAKVADAQVSSDGTTITLKDGETIEELGVFAFRVAQ